MLVGKNIMLRKIEDADTDLIVNWRNKENVVKNFFIQEPLTSEVHRKWLQTKVYTGEVAQFVIVDVQSNTPIGSTFLRDIDLKNKKAEFGIFIGEDNARGKGFGSEAAQLICEYGFEELKLHRIFLRVFSHNERAIRSYNKAGFDFEGELKDDVRIQDKFYNVTIMAKLNVKEVL